MHTDRNQPISLRSLNSLSDQSRRMSNISGAGVNIEGSVGNPILSVTPGLPRSCTARIKGPAMDDEDKPILDGDGNPMYLWVEERRVIDEDSGDPKWEDCTSENTDGFRGSIDAGEPGNKDGDQPIHMAHEANGGSASKDDHVIMWAGVLDSGDDGEAADHEHVFYETPGPQCGILYDDMTPDAEDKLFYPAKDDLTADTTTDPPTKTKVSDGVLKNSRAFGKVHSGFDADKAARFWYAKGPDGKNHIVAINNLANTIIVSGPSSTVAAGAAFAAVLASCDDGQSPTGNPTGGTFSTTTSPKVFNWNQMLPASATGVKCIRIGADYYVIDADCGS